MKRRKIYIIVGVSIVILAIIGWMSYLHIWKGYLWADWTGFGDYIAPAVGTGQVFQRGKTLWDLMGLLVIPVVLAFGVYLFNRSERRNEIKRAEEADRKIAEESRRADREIALDRQQEALLQNYINYMSELLLKDHLLDRIDFEADPIVIVAQVRTVTTIMMLDGYRRNILFQFLRDAELKNFILANASLDLAELREANLRGYTLFEADLTAADLAWANLTGADLTGADLTGADLTGANLTRADLTRANLTRASITKEQLDKAASLENAILPDGTKHV